MIYRQHVPPPPLCYFVEHFWYHQGFRPECPRERLIPDGAIELIIDLGTSPKRLFDPEDYGRFSSFQKAWISGQHSEHLIIEATSDGAMIGVRFRPGGSHPFLKFDISDLNDSVVQLDLIWGRFIHEVRDRLLETPALDARFRILEEMLMRRALGQFEQDRGVAYAVREIVARPGEVSVRALSETTGYSEKQLIRRFARSVGQKPKTLVRVFRLQLALQQLERGPVSWSFIANECGYFDQAHFIKDFKALSGLNPSRYLQDRGEYLNFVPVR